MITKNGGQPSLTGKARAYCSACPRAASIASSQAAVPRKAVPRRALPRVADSGSGASRSPPCVASSTKQPRL